MFRRQYYFSLIFILIAIATIGQTKSVDTLTVLNERHALPRNIVYGQLLGDVFLAGVNYERVYTKNKFVNLSARVGIGVIGNGYDVILGNNILFGKNILYIETGINPLLVISAGTQDFMVTGNIGLRYHAKRDGFFLRLAYNPILYNQSDGNILPLAIGIGAGF